MDLLDLAVVDITTLVATCHALRSSPTDGGPAMPRGRGQRLRRELRRGTLAYIDTLARSRGTGFDAELLTTCRVAAEAQMTVALRHQEPLRRLMAGQTGALDSLAAARQDLWRLAHMAVYLRLGLADWGEAGDARAAGATADAAASLRRRLRRAMIAYARTTLRTKLGRRRKFEAARASAVAAIGRRGLSHAERLASVEADRGAAQPLLSLGVAKPLADLMLDWPAAV